MQVFLLVKHVCVYYGFANRKYFTKNLVTSDESTHYFTHTSVTIINYY